MQEGQIELTGFTRHCFGVKGFVSYVTAARISLNSGHAAPFLGLYLI